MSKKATPLTLDEQMALGMDPVGEFVADLCGEWEDVEFTDDEQAVVDSARDVIWQSLAILTSHVPLLEDMNAETTEQIWKLLKSALAGRNAVRAVLLKKEGHEIPTPEECRRYAETGNSTLH